MISWSSSLASSTPATSRNVTFFCADEESFALLFPNDSALLPPLWTCRMKKTQNPIISRMGAQYDNTAIHGEPVGSFASTMTLRSMSLLASPSYCGGEYVRKLSFDFVM